MLHVYVNYPNSVVSFHTDTHCSHIGQAKKEGQRWILVDTGTISEELTAFRKQKYAFGSSQEINDMWIGLDFGDNEYEVATLRYIKSLLAHQYVPFREADLTTHC